MVRDMTERLDPLMQVLLWIGGVALLLTCCFCGAEIMGWW